MPQKHSKLDTGILYTTGLLFLDVVVGQAINGRPLHESMGVELLNYMQAIEYFAVSTGLAYSLCKPFLKPYLEIERGQKKNLEKVISD